MAWRVALRKHGGKAYQRRGGIMKSAAWRIIAYMAYTTALQA